MKPNLPNSYQTLASTRAKDLTILRCWISFRAPNRSHRAPCRLQCAMLRGAPVPLRAPHRRTPLPSPPPPPPCCQTPLPPVSFLPSQPGQARRHGGLGFDKNYKGGGFSQKHPTSGPAWHSTWPKFAALAGFGLSMNRKVEFRDPDARFASLGTQAKLRDKFGDLECNLLINLRSFGGPNFSSQLLFSITHVENLWDENAHLTRLPPGHPRPRSLD